MEDNMNTSDMIKELCNKKYKCFWTCQKDRTASTELWEETEMRYCDPRRTKADSWCYGSDLWAVVYLSRRESDKNE